MPAGGRVAHREIRTSGGMDAPEQTSGLKVKRPLAGSHCSELFSKGR